MQRKTGEISCLRRWRAIGIVLYAESMTTDDFDIVEFNHGYGYVDFRTKLPKKECSLSEFLRYATM